MEHRVEAAQGIGKGRYAVEQYDEPESPGKEIGKGEQEDKESRAQYAGRYEQDQRAIGFKKGCPVGVVEAQTQMSAKLKTAKSMNRGLM